MEALYQPYTPTILPPPPVVLGEATKDDPAFDSPLSIPQWVLLSLNTSLHRRYTSGWFVENL